MLPAALSILTTTFTEPADRHKALGVWGGVGGLASAAGVLLGGLLTDGPGWRWVFFVNPPAAALVLVARLPADRAGRPPRRERRGFDLVGAVLVTAGMLLLVFTLVQAPDEGWGSTATVLRLVGVGVLLVAFVAKEATGAHPLLPLTIFRVRGLAAADVTQLIAFAGFLAIFFFLTLYMQNVLGYSPIKTGAAYLPLCGAIGVSAGITGQLIARIGTRPLIVGRRLITSAGVFELSRIPVHGSYVARSAARAAHRRVRHRRRLRRDRHRGQRRRAERTRRGLPPRCSTPRSNSAARSGWPSSPRSPPRGRTSCSVSTTRCRTR